MSIILAFNLWYRLGTYYLHNYSLIRNKSFFTTKMIVMHGREDVVLNA